MKLKNTTAQRLNMLAEEYIIAKDIFESIQLLTKKEITNLDVSLSLESVAMLDGGEAMEVYMSILEIINEEEYGI